MNNNNYNLEKLLQSIRDIEEQISIIDIQIATDLSIGKENKQSNERKYQLQKELQCLNMYTAYLQNDLDTLDQITNNNNSNNNNKTSSSSYSTNQAQDSKPNYKLPDSNKFITCKNCKFIWSVSSSKYCSICNKLL